MCPSAHGKPPQKITADSAHAPIRLVDAVFGTWTAKSRVNTGVLGVFGQMLDFAREGQVLAVDRAMQKQDLAVRVPADQFMQHADHGGHANTGADQGQWRAIARDQEVDGGTAGVDDIAHGDMVMQITRGEAAGLAFHADPIASDGWGCRNRDL